MTVFKDFRKKLDMMNVPLSQIIFCVYRNFILGITSEPVLVMIIPHVNFSAI